MRLVMLQGAQEPTASDTPTLAPTQMGTSTNTTGDASGPGNTSGQAASASNQATRPKFSPRLEDIFDLERNTFGLIVAATFGLLPALLVRTLERQIEQYKKDIQSTEASDPGGSRSA